MEVHRLITGYIDGNTYLISGEGNEVVIVDAGGTADNIIKYIEELGLKPSYLLLTHGHYDHTEAAEGLMERYDMQLAIHKADVEMLNDPLMSAQPFDHELYEIPTPDLILEDGDTINTAGLEIGVIHTPGHTPGSVCFTCGKYLFSGDTLFYEGVGRTDFPGGSFEELKQSLNKLCALEKNYTVCPGHGNSTSLESEKASNPYLNR